MLNTSVLRTILKEIYGIEDRYLVPLNDSWFVPTVDLTGEDEDDIGTWIGYKILSKVPYARTFQSGSFMVKPVRVKFRLSFVGPQAEEEADRVIMWEDRTDVIKAFEVYGAQINYSDRTVFTHPVQNSGFNDSLCWIVDLSAQTTYEVDTQQKPWIIPKGSSGGSNGE